MTDAKFDLILESFRKFLRRGAITHLSNMAFKRSVKSSSRAAEIGKISANSNSARLSSIIGSTRGFSTRSTLLRMSSTGARRGRRRSRTARSPGPSGAVTSTRNRITSASSRAARAALTMASLRRWRGLWRPGVSTKMSSAPGTRRTPTTRVRVVCGTSETIATFSPTRRLISVDFPTLGRPTKAIVPLRNTPVALA